MLFFVQSLSACWSAERHRGASGEEVEWIKGIYLPSLQFAYAVAPSKEHLDRTG